jgi:hypothetical protein
MSICALCSSVSKTASSAARFAGSGTIQASAGDLVDIEPETVHRERYGEGELATVGFCFGSGPGRVDVDGPDRG